jgi:hypothetical protein
MGIKGKTVHPAPTDLDSGAGLIEQEDPCIHTPS